MLARVIQSMTLKLTQAKSTASKVRLGQPEGCKSVHKHIKIYKDKKRSLLTPTRFSLGQTRISKMFQNKPSRLAKPKPNPIAVLAARTNKVYCQPRLKTDEEGRVRIQGTWPTQTGCKQSFAEHKANEGKRTRTPAALPSQVGGEQSYSKQKANKGKITRKQAAGSSQACGKLSYSKREANKRKKN